MNDIGRLGVLQYLIRYFFYGSHQFFNSCSLTGSTFCNILCTDSQLIASGRHLFGRSLNTVHSLTDLVHHIIQFIQYIAELSYIRIGAVAMYIKITLSKMLYKILQI